MVSHIFKGWLYLYFPACSNVWSWGDWTQLTARSKWNKWLRMEIQTSVYNVSAPCIYQLLSAYSIVDGSPFSSMMAAQWRMKWKSSTSGYTMTPLFFDLANLAGSVARFQWFNLVALLDFNNFIGAIWLKLWETKESLGVVGGTPKKKRKKCIHRFTAASFTT